jgi:hypothetical protein
VATKLGGPCSHAGQSDQSAASPDRAAFAVALGLILDCAVAVKIDEITAKLLVNPFVCLDDALPIS